MGTLLAARTLAVCVAGGPGLTMLEVNRVMEAVKERSQGAPAAMGASIDTAAGESLLIGLLIAPNLPEPSQETAPAKTGHAITRPTVPGKLENHLLGSGTAERPQSRYVAPAPSFPQEKMEQMLARQSPGASRARKPGPKMRQTQLPLEIVSKGRFDKSEPTLHKGEDLDVPTYIRRGVVLN